MHNPTRYRATFRDLIITAFEKEQTLKLKIELTMYQISSSPEKWTFTPTLPTGRPHMEASSPVELARLIEGAFVFRETEWVPAKVTLHHQEPRRAQNVVSIDRRRRA